MKQLDELRDMAEELSRASAFSNDELGQWWNCLAALLPRVVDSASPAFLKAYEKQLRAEHKRFKTEFRLEEVTEKKTVTYTRLLHETE